LRFYIISLTQTRAGTFCSISKKISIKQEEKRSVELSRAIKKIFHSDFEVSEAKKIYLKEDKKERC
jgi:hypothetical protein